MSTVSKRNKVLKQSWSFEFARNLNIVETILRNPTAHFKSLRSDEGLLGKVTAMLISSIALLAVYGAILGSTHSLLQAISAGIKLPLVFIGTAFICLPTLYIFSLMFGSTQRLGQTIALVITAITVMAAILLSLAPITFLFLLTTNDYQFFKLLNITFFGLAGFVGLYFLHKGRHIMAEFDQTNLLHNISHKFIDYTWTLLFVFAGCQLAWALRPFFGFPGAPFEIVRELKGNFYSDILMSLGEAFGLWTVIGM